MKFREPQKTVNLTCQSYHSIDWVRQPMNDKAAGYFQLQPAQLSDYAI